MGGWLLIVGTIGALLAFVFMRTSLDTFFWRKSSQAIRERRPIEWRDPQTWMESKKAAVQWVAIVTAYLGLGIGLTSLFPDVASVIAPLFVALPVVLFSWAILMRTVEVR